MQQVAIAVAHADNLWSAQLPFGMMKVTLGGSCTGNMLQSMLIQLLL
jgi:hypothetical protein